MRRRVEVRATPLERALQRHSLEPPDQSGGNEPIELASGGGETLGRHFVHGARWAEVVSLGHNRRGQQAGARRTKAWRPSELSNYLQESMDAQ